MLAKALLESEFMLSLAICLKGIGLDLDEFGSRNLGLKLEIGFGSRLHVELLGCGLSARWRWNNRVISLLYIAFHLDVVSVEIA